MTNKVTKREMFNAVKGFIQGGDLKFSVDEVVAFIDHEIDLLDKKSANKKPTKTQTENEGIKAVILEILASAETPKTVTELIKSDDRLSDFSTPKVTALLKQLVQSDKVVRTEEKKVARFSVA